MQKLPQLRPTGQPQTDHIAALLEQHAQRTAELVLERLDGRLSSPAQAPPPLLSKQNMAAALGVSTATVDRLVRDHRIPFVQVGDSRRFDLVAVRASLEATDPEPDARDATPAGTVRRLRRVRAAGSK